LPADISNYVDLTAEFQEPPRARKLSGYLSFPLLDAGAPEPQRLQQIIASLKPGRTFVHCAQGHGRTGLFALATLFAERTVTTVDEGLTRLQSVRPGIHLNLEQRGCVDKFARLISREGAAR
jgi:protein-tyrosine phosphatase